MASFIIKAAGRMPALLLARGVHSSQDARAPSESLHSYGARASRPPLWAMRPEPGLQSNEMMGNAQNRLLSELSKFLILTNSMGWTLVYEDRPVNSPEEFGLVD